MKRWMLLFACIQTLIANKDYELFLMGNQYCKTGQYQKAVDTYNDIKDVSSAVLYNRGYALYALNRYGKALADFRCAQLRASRLLRKKIDNAVIKTQMALGVEQDSWLHRVMIVVDRIIPLGALQLLLFLNLILLLLVFIRPPENKIDRWVRLVGVPIISALLVNHYTVHKPRVMAVVQEAQMFVGPNKEFHVIGSLKEGVEAKLVDENDLWCKMLYRNSAGWVQKGDVQIIRDSN